VRKQPIRPIATAKKMPGAEASSTTPIGSTKASRVTPATTGNVIRKPSTAQPPLTIDSLGWRTAYHAFAPIRPATMVIPETVRDRLTGTPTRARIAAWTATATRMATTARAV
jgi:hypothetical protein